MSTKGRPEGEYRSAQRERGPVDHPARGRARSVGIDGKANATCGRQRNGHVTKFSMEAAA
jgi:hypothetical protein